MVKKHREQALGPAGMANSAERQNGPLYKFLKKGNPGWKSYQKKDKRYFFLKKIHINFFD